MITRKTGAARRAPRVYLDAPAARVRDEFLHAVRRSVALHRPWVWPPSTAAAYTRFVARSGDPARRFFLVRERVSAELVGVVNLSEIVLGNLRSAYLGYYGFEPFSRRGYMSEAVSLVLDVAFRTLRLHRVEANVQPSNVRSLALLRRLGFREEGFSPEYLRVGGRYRDHVRTAILAREWAADGKHQARVLRRQRATR